jgi:hypothetical protein
MVCNNSDGVICYYDIQPYSDDSYKNGISTKKWSETHTVKLNTTGQVNMTNLPTSSSGLSTGDLWNDSGTIKIAT